MLRTSLLASLALALCAVAGSARAVPVIAVLDGTDGRFQFSVVHTATGGNDGQSGTILGDVDLGAAGGTWSLAGDVGTLDLQLDVDAAGSVSRYRAVGDFSLSALAELATQADVMLGSLAFTLEAGADDAGLEGLTFYFENRTYSDAAAPPNGLEVDGAGGHVLTLWGASAFTGSGVLGDRLDLVAGGRGLDLRLHTAPIPEPGSRPLYAMGLLLVALGAAGLRRR